MSLYIIRKSHRMEVAPYTGPTCENAGVRGNRIYVSLTEAAEDCRKLNAVSPMFEVVSTTRSELEVYMSLDGYDLGDD